MSIVIHQSVSSSAPQATAAPIALQSGSVVSARVLQVAGNAAQIAINGHAIDVVSEVPLQAGQTLQLAVSQTADSIQLAVVDQQPAAVPAEIASASLGTSPSTTSGTPVTVTLTPAALASLPPQTTPAATAAVQLTPQEMLAVTAAAQSAATQQAGLAPLFANLDIAAGSNNLPPQVQQAVAQVLSYQVSLDHNLTGNDIQKAFQTSGLFLEASLASGSLPAPATAPDLKAALIVLRQALNTALAATAAQTPSAALGGPRVGQPVPIVPQAPPSAASAPSAVVVGSAGTTPEPAAQPAASPQPAATVPQGATLAAAPTEAAPSVAALVAEQGLEPIIQGALQALPQAAATASAPDAQLTASPPLVPLPASEIASPEDLLAAAATATAAEDGLTLAVVGETLAPASTAAVAEAALAAASGAALTLLQEALQAEPLVAGFTPQMLFNNATMLSLLPAAAGAHTLKEDDADLTRSLVPPPPISGGVPTAQPVVPATLVTNSPAETAMHHLLSETEGAIARQVLLQVASLPRQADASSLRLDAGALRWNFEIPFATPQGAALAQFEIARDGGGGSSNSGKAEGPKAVWRARFSLDVEPAGPVHALITLNGERTAVRMWAERPATAAQLRAGAGELSQALSAAALKPGDIVIREGAPPQPASAKAGHFLDRAL